MNINVILRFNGNEFKMDGDTCFKAHLGNELVVGRQGRFQFLHGLSEDFCFQEGNHGGLE